MKSFERKLTLALALGALFTAQTAALRHKDPFYYQEKQVTTVANEDGSLIKKLNVKHGDYLYSRRNFVAAVPDSWEMDLGWYGNLK